MAIFSILKQCARRLAPECVEGLSRWRAKRRMKVRRYRTDAIPGVEIEMFAEPTRLWEARLTKPCGHEVGVCRRLQELLTTANVFFDIGSLYGFFSVFANTVKPSVAVHAFEPSWVGIHVLKMNSHLTALRTGAHEWQINDTCILNCSGGIQGGYWVNEKMALAIPASKVMCIDDYVLSRNVTPDVIKMDIDGGEVEALRGMRRLLAGGRTTFLIEVHPKELAERSQGLTHILDEIDGERYDVSYLCDLRSGEGQWTGSVNADELTDDIYICIKPKKSS